MVRDFHKCASRLAISMVLLGCAVNPSMAATPDPQDFNQAPSAPANPSMPPGSLPAARPSSQDSTATSTSPVPAAPQALIFVYRQGHMGGAWQHALVFINREVVAELHNSNYTQHSVPPGTVTVSASFAYLGSIKKRGGSGSELPQSVPECVGLDVLRLGDANMVDIQRCGRALEDAGVRLAEILAHGPEIRDPEPLRTLCHIAPSYGTRHGASIYLFDQRAVEQCRNDMLTAFTALYRIVAGVVIKAEAGRTYYVKWSVSGFVGKLQVVDAATGAKEMKKLHPAKGW